MAKTRSFSIYLLKPGFDAANALKEGNKLDEAGAVSLPEGASLFILDTPPAPPWWRDFFGVEKELRQEFKGALVFFPVGDRCFAVAFGQVYHHIDERAYEYDFGLKVTLNSLDPKELKSADMMAPGTARRKRTQVAASTDLTFLDFDGNSEIIKSLTGKVKEEFKDLFKNATGSSALRVNMKIEPVDLPEICGQLLELYGREDYKTSFPNIQNISPVLDPDKIDELSAILLQAFREDRSSIVLAIPDIVDYKDTKTCCIFRGPHGASDVFPDISIEGFYQYLGDGFDYNALTVDAIRSFSLVLCDLDGQTGQSFGLYRSLVFDTPEQPDGAIYHLSDGSWYRAEAAFVEKITSYVDAKCRASHLPPYNHDAEKDGRFAYSEEKYNAALPGWNANFVCLDQTDISPDGSTQVEPCDAFAIDPADNPTVGRFYHVKISTRSSQLSHLFNQGINSIELLKGEAVSRTKLSELLTARVGAAHAEPYLVPLETSNYEVIFGVITHKNPADRGRNLPLFSRLSLMRTMQQLQLYGVASALMFIGDESPHKHGHTRFPVIRVVVAAGEKGKKWVHAVPGQEGIDPTIVIKRCPKEIREAPIGTVFVLAVNTSIAGQITSYHNWDFEVIED